MNKINYLRFIASFMITLIITIPIYSASVFAGLSNTKAKGSDGIDGYVRVDDYITFETTASISGDVNITPNQVWLGVMYAFNNCPAGISGFDCRLRFPASGTTTSSPQAILYTINLCNDTLPCPTGPAVSSFDGAVIVDNKEPAVAIFSIIPEFTSTGKVNLSYSVVDYACDDASCSNKCSGISKIQFYRNDFSSSPFDTATINSADCLVVGNRTYTSTLSSGTETICAKVFDRFMQNSTSVVCDTLTVDQVPPSVIGNSLSIVDSSNNPLNYISSQAIPITVTINISSNDLDKNNVIGDLSKLNPNGNYGKLNAVCNETISNTTACSWSINLQSSAGGTFYIYVNSTDIAGNKGTAMLSKSLTFDSTGPVVNSLTSGRVYNSVYQAKAAGNNFIATITDSESGIRKENITLHLSALDPFDTFYGQQDFKAYNCTGGTCYWYNIGISPQDEDVIKAYIGTDSTDALGNSVAAEYSIEVALDAEAPALAGISIKNIGVTSTAFEGYPKTGDKLEITANLTEANAMDTSNTVGDFSSIITGTNKVSADSCTGQGGSWQCKWTTKTINVTQYTEATLYFNFTDSAGNVLQHSEKITVYAVENVTTPDFWSNSVECSPSKIDRSTTTLISNKVFCHVSLSPKEQDTSTLFMSLGSCEASNQSFASTFELMNAANGSVDPYILATLPKAEMKIDSLDYTCPLGIISKVDGKITQFVETENVSIEILFYNLPLGEYSSEVQGKIDDAKAATEGIWNLIGTLKKLFNYAEMACNMLGLIDKIRMVFMVITKGLDVIRWNPPGEAAATKVCVKTEIIKEGEKGLYKTAKKFCAFITCDYEKLGLDTWGFGENSILRKWNTAGKNILNTLSFGTKWTGKDPYSYMNPRDNLPVAVLTACIPGIIYGLDKYRQIECMYADCLQNNQESGLPLSVCDDEKEYATCKYVYGELFGFISFTALFDYFFGMIKNALSDPLALVGVVMGLVCIGFCPLSGTLLTTCQITELLSMVGDIWSSISSILEGDAFQIKNDYCVRL